MQFTFHGVNDAFESLVGLFVGGTLPALDQDSRDGRVASIEEPVIICYENPRQRVLFNEARDANPFFHLYEALWILAGRNDVASVAHFAKEMTRFSDDGETLNGAYGYRWRHADSAATLAELVADEGQTDRQDRDQLDILVQHLKESPFSRRSILVMWNVEDDLMKINKPDISKDVCCNIAVKFRVMPGLDGTPQTLNMTVFNRSNDLTWGCLGANVVHFSFLQEYIALRLGLEVGKYYQIADDLHLYYEREGQKPDEYLEWYSEKYRDQWSRERFTYEARDRYTSLNVTRMRGSFGDLKSEDIHRTFMEELQLLVDWAPVQDAEFTSKFKFFSFVCKPMFSAHMHVKRKQFDDAWKLIKDQIQKNEKYGEDWLYAGLQWIERRKANYERKVNK